MHFSVVSILSTALLLSPAVAVDFQWFTGYSCGTAYWKVSNAAQNMCQYSSTTAHAIGIYGLASGAKGQIYAGGSADRCTQYVMESTISNQCLSTTYDIHSANWFYPGKRLMRKDEEPVEPERYSVGYVLPDGTPREIELPDNDFDPVLKLVQAKDYDALAKFPDFVKN